MAPARRALAAVFLAASDGTSLCAKRRFDALELVSDCYGESHRFADAAEILVRAVALAQRPGASWPQRENDLARAHLALASARSHCEVDDKTKTQAWAAAADACAAAGDDATADAAAKRAQSHEPERTATD